jgi:fucose permease
LLLLSMPAGVLVMNPMSIFILKKIGINHSTVLFGILMGIAFALPISFPAISLVAVGLFLSGGAFAGLNVAMNTYASNLEANHNMRLMSACHGMWSLGAMSGALISSLAFGWLAFMADYMPPQIAYVWLDAILMFAFVMLISKNIHLIQEPVADESHEKTSALSIFKPNAALLLLASILICTYFTEGTMADWSAVYMKDLLHSPASMVGWGYSMYAGFMAGGRFIGDELIHRYTDKVVLRWGGFLVIIGMLWIVLATNPWIVLPGFMLVGLGISLASPILYAASAKVKGLAPGVGLATMNSFGMAAFLTGPVIVGFIAKLVDLRFAFLWIVFASVLWIIQTSRWIKKE